MNKNIEKTVAELLELRRLREDLSGEIAAIQGEIELYMTQNGADTLEAAGCKITYRPIEQSRFNKAAFVKEYGEEVYKRFCKNSSSMRFNVRA